MIAPGWYPNTPEDWAAIRATSADLDLVISYCNAERINDALDLAELVAAARMVERAEWAERYPDEAEAMTEDEREADACVRCRSCGHIGHDECDGSGVQS